MKVSQSNSLPSLKCKNSDHMDQLTDTPLRMSERLFNMPLKMVSESSLKWILLDTSVLGEEVKSTRTSQLHAMVESSITIKSILQSISLMKPTISSSRTSKIYSQTNSSIWVVMKLMVLAGDYALLFLLSWQLITSQLMMIYRSTTEKDKVNLYLQTEQKSTGLTKPWTSLLLLKMSFSTGDKWNPTMSFLASLTKLFFLLKISCTSTQESISFGAISLETSRLGWTSTKWT